VKRFKALAWFVVVAAVIFCVSLAVVWLGDDVDYGYYITDSIWNSYGHIGSVARFFASQANHYWYVNGRAVAHALVQLFCAVAGKPAFAAANALMYCAFIYLILKISRVRSITANVGAAITCTVVVLITFVTKMMPTTQIGFVWMFTLNLLWLRLFFNHRNRSTLEIALICLLGIIAGNGQEALTLGLSAALGLWWLHRRCRIGAARTAMLICYWMGTLAICCSPGTLGRAHAMDISFSQSLLYMAMSLRATYMLIITLAVLKLNKQISLRNVYRQNALFVNTLLIMLIFNMCIGVYCNRQLFGAELMAVLVMMRTLPQHRFNVAVRVFAVVFTALLISLQWIGILKINQEYRDIEQLFTKSDNGIVYYDRTLAYNNTWMREYRYYEEIVGQFNNDTHHSLQKDMRYKHPDKKKSMHVWPKYMNGVKTVHDTIIEYAPQHYFIIILDAKPTTPVMHIGKRAVPLKLEKSVVHGKGWQSMLVVPHTPFAPIDSITVN
jgi:hypothetical protein